MKIIQSYARFDEGNPYLVNKNVIDGGVYLLFYTFFLSFLTLKKYYGAVTMYCNESAYNSFIKYIPYDEIVFRENINNMVFWSKYKVDVINEQNNDFIHVDSDVFIFDSIFDSFIETSVYDMIVQDTLPPDTNFTKHFMYANKEKLFENQIFDVNNYDGKCFSQGVIGLRKQHINNYIEKTNKIYNGFRDGYLLADESIQGGIAEELASYLIFLENNLKAYNIIPYEEIVKANNNPRTLGQKYKYTHMWFTSKFLKSNIDLIKNKIKTDFPNSYHIVENYDKHVSKLDVKYLEYIK